MRCSAHCAIRALGVSSCWRQMRWETQSEMFPGLLLLLQATENDMPRFADEDLQLILDDVATYKQA